ncbi:agamous-like MADS-box protein TM6 [Arachis stenosperma]|uniref:agamous-like MADS-box protein TM6 n=1 Tax=Arachis stenosperma TaxID=217475 RepID=UPI0025AC2BEE|nr:agamous-like MADS-box protein TM6 [Arachis stenosperma]
MVIKTVELLKGFASHEEIMEILATVAADLGDVIDFHVIRTRTETCRKKVKSLEHMNGNLLLELVQEEFMHIWLMDADSCPY